MSISAIGFESLVETWRPGEVGYEQSRARANSMIGSDDRIVWMLREDAEGHWSKVGLRRSAGWLEALGGRDVGVGDWVELNLPEMGATGDYQVMSIEPAPAVRVGSGRPVTGLFQFSHGVVYNLSISGQSAPIGVTENHPIWSVDREDWVPARDLQIGERVLTRDGPTNVTGFEYAGEEPVFNLEVDGDHCYRVGEAAVLVHNASAIPPIMDAAFFAGSRVHPTMFELASAAYSILKAAGDTKDQLTPHHVLQNKYIAVAAWICDASKSLVRPKHNDGIAFNMESPDGGNRDGVEYPNGVSCYKGRGRHQRTRTFSRSPVLSNSPRQELDADIEDIRSIYKADDLLTGTVEQALVALKSKIEQLLKDSQGRPLFSSPEANKSGTELQKLKPGGKCN